MRRGACALVSVLALLFAATPVGTAHAATGCPRAIPPAAFSSTVVTTTADDGEGSLRAAIDFANNDPGPNTISFAIPLTDPGFTLDGEDGWFTIRPLTPLTELLDDGTSIDGLSQTAFTGNTNPLGPEVQLDGSLMSADEPAASGLAINSNRNTVQGLVINRFGGVGIYVGCGPLSKIGAVVGNVIRGNYIGTGARGKAAIPNGLGGVFVDFASGTVIGGSGEADRNLIAGNGAAGVRLAAISTNTTIRRNGMFENGGLGIDLGPDGPSPDGAGTGPSVPQIDSARSAGRSVIVRGSVSMDDPRSVAVELFGNESADPSGYGEGLWYLGRVTPNSRGDFVVRVNADLAGSFVTATATDLSGTSEFSLAAPVRRHGLGRSDGGGSDED